MAGKKSKKNKKHSLKHRIKRRIPKKSKHFTLRDQLMMQGSEETILAKQRGILSFMRSGMVFIAIGIIIVYLFTQNLLQQAVGWTLIVIGFAEILESYHRMGRYMKGKK